MEQSAPPHRRTDGRLLRSERTKQVLIESYLDLLRENPQIPTASDIGAPVAPFGLFSSAFPTF